MPPHKDANWEEKPVVQGECDKRHGRIRNWGIAAIGFAGTLVVVGAGSIGYAVSEAVTANKAAASATQKVESFKEEQREFRRWMKESVDDIKIELRSLRDKQK